jgi:hypothetical protein
MLASLKLIDLVEENSERIARQWAKDAVQNEKTPFYRTLPEEKIVIQALKFYDHFRRLFSAKKPFEAAREFFSVYAEERYREGMPLQEAIYGLILMRRHIWLYAEFQAVFISAVEQKQAVDSLTRTILMFDYAVYFITQKYQELLRNELWNKIEKLAIISAKNPGLRMGIMAVFMAAAAALTYYSHAVRGAEVIFTHLFYVPIVFAAIWWQKKGIWIAVCLAVYLLLSHLVFMKGMPLFDDVLRGVMFIAIATVVALLSEGIGRLEKFYEAVVESKAS